MSNHRSSYSRLTRAATFSTLLLLAGSISTAMADVGAGTTPSAPATARSKLSSNTVTYTYKTLDYPGSSQTIFWGINDFGDLAGQYSIAGGTSHAMVYRHGQFEPLDPDALGDYFSAAGGPNDYGTTFGGYTDASGQQHGFVIQRGHLATVDFPGHLNSNVDQVNLFNAIAGVYWDADGVFHGVLRLGRGYDVPINVTGARDTYPLGINDKGEVVGYWDTNPAQKHGFYRSANGQLTTINVPGAIGTVSLEINNYGQITGNYEDASGAVHGFVETQGKFQNIDMPGAVATVATAINNMGVIAGEYYDAAGMQHGFTATPH